MTYDRYQVLYIGLYQVIYVMQQPDIRYNMPICYLTMCLTSFGRIFPRSCSAGFVDSG